MKKYLKLWWLYALFTTQVGLVSRIGMILFVTGKLLRFLFFLGFIFIVLSHTRKLAGYSFAQTVLFFAVFNFIDTASQLLMREVYRFRPQVVSGMFDYTLVKPISPLFKAVFGGSDAFDIPLFVISVLLVIYSGISAGIGTPLNYFFFIFMIINSLLIAFAFHVFVIALGILTTEVDNTIMIYRDLTQMGRFPVDIYKEPLRGLITFIIPVGIMMTFPAKVLLGFLDIRWILISALIAALCVLVSLSFWKYALSKYTSAGS